MSKYRIGTVAQLTGLSADTIRAWERRYGCIEPARTAGGTRLYGEDDVTRLQLLRALTEAGHPVGAVARRGTEELRALLAHFVAGRDGERHAASAPEKLRVAILDASLPEQLRWAAAEAAPLEVVASACELPSFVNRLETLEVDALVVHLARLGANPVAGLDACLDASGARVALVVYEFASRKMLARLAASGARLMRGPVGVAELCRALLDRLAIGDADRQRGDPLEDPVAAYRPRLELAAPARAYDDDQLARLRELRSTVDCECPNHLASIISALVAFEAYSAACESRDPTDAALHALLARGTGHARSLMEQLLARVCEQDGIRP